MRTLSALLALALAACGGSSNQTTSAVTPAPIDPGEVAPTPATGEVGPTADDARVFVKELDGELRRLYVEQSQAQWNNQTDITPDHEAAAAKASEAVLIYTTAAIKRSRRFDPIMDQLDGDTRRQILLLRISGAAAPDDPAQAAELARITTEMDSLYGKSKACDAKGTCRDLDALEEVLAKSRKPAELLAAWQGWHDTTGRAEKPLYEKFVTLANAGAKAVGFADVGVMWRSAYDMPPDAFAQEVDRIWNQAAPLYKDLHCYARRKLNKKYGDKVVSKTGPLPAHLLGNMWAQTWGYLYPELEPFKGVAALDVTPAIVKQKYDPIKMVKRAEAFFVSLGLNPLPASFWERSMLTKPAGKEVVCHASAWDVTFSNDLRIKMCIKPNYDDLVTIHHELGHDYYFNNYYTLPVLYQGGANDGFHEAIGDTIALSMTPSYLKEVGLLSKVVKNDKAVINQQMNIALDKIAFMPFGLLIDQWRWDVFAGKVTPEQYNQHWWDLRLKYQGVAPPEPRAAAEFDPGAKYHVPANVPYTRYFLALVLQFQMHRALCKKAGHTGPLNECSIFKSKEAGEALRAMLALGASKPWPDALEAMTGERTMDAGAMLEYFAPLTAWLAEQNKGQTCGW